MSETAGKAAQLDWLMEQFVRTVPHTRAVQLASVDGLKLARHGLDDEQADYLSAILSAHLPMFNGSLKKVTRSPGTVHEDTVVNAGDTLAFIVSAGEGAILCALTERSADIGVVGFELGELVGRVGEHLGAAPREGQPAAVHDALS